MSTYYLRTVDGSEHQIDAYSATRLIEAFRQAPVHGVTTISDNLHVINAHIVSILKEESK